ncbi:MAG: hypothetical protein EON58_18455 [Alphaproteobacteria bacterium]|nr:MAG: hypothetical protein EON58_18455 [Alphaproteobacteria bacterium]
MAGKLDPATVEFETRAKNLLKGELKRRGVSYQELTTKLAALGVHETERNLANKLSRGGFSAAFFLQCLKAIGASSLHLEE